MHDIITIIKFTIKDMIKRKSFLISTIIILAFIVIGFNIPKIINNFDGEIIEELVIKDANNIFEGNLETLNELNLGYKVIVTDVSEEKLKEMVEAGKINSAYVVNNNDNNIEINYIVNSSSLDSEIPGDVLNILQTIYTDMQLNKLGLNEEEVAKLKPNFTINVEQIGEENNNSYLILMFASILLFYAIYFSAYQVSSSITTEKTSRVIETLVTSTTPKSIVIGKTIGVGLVGMFQLILMIITAFISAKLFLEKELLNSLLGSMNINFSLAFIVLFYFILGYLLYALLYALTGSTVSKPEDIQSANGPVAIIAVLSFYLSYFTMMMPENKISEFASYFPLSSPFCMPFRVMMEIPYGAQVLLSILILVISIIIVAQITIKVYSNAILNYGNRLNIHDIVKIFKNK